METRFLVDETGKQTGVIISLKEYNLYRSLLDSLEMDEDVKAYDKAIADFKKNPTTYTIDELKKRLGHV